MGDGNQRCVCRLGGGLAGGLENPDLSTPGVRSPIFLPGKSILHKHCSHPCFNIYLLLFLMINPIVQDGYVLFVFSYYSGRFLSAPKFRGTVLLLCVLGCRFQFFLSNVQILDMHGPWDVYFEQVSPCSL
jgi:hypothetical protein